MTGRADQSVQDEKITGMLNDQNTSQSESNADFRREIADLKARMGAVEDEVVMNTKMTIELRQELRETIGSDVREMVDGFRSVKGGFKVLGWLGAGAKWVTAITAFFVAMWAIVQNVRGVK